MGIMLVFLLFGMWSIAFPVGKYLLQYSPPIFLTGFRMTLAGVVLLLFLFLRKKIPKTISRRQIISLLALTFFSVYLTNILEFWSLSHLSATKTCFIYSLSPFITAILSYIHLKEKMTPMKCLGIFIGVLGFIPVIMFKTGTEGLLQAFCGFTWPEISMFGAAFFSVYGWVILRIIVKNENMSPFLANGVSMFLGGLLALGTSYFVDPWNPLPFTLSSFPTLFSNLLFLTFISNIICYNLYGFLLKRYTATLISIFGLLSPIFTSIHSFVILKEPFSPAIILSTFIVLFGLWIVYREEQKQGYIQSST